MAIRGELFLSLSLAPWYYRSSNSRIVELYSGVRKGVLHRHLTCFWGYSILLPSFRCYIPEAHESGKHLLTVRDTKAVFRVHTATGDTTYGDQPDCRNVRANQERPE